MSDGNPEWGIIREGHQVVVRFNQPITWAKLDPQNAFEIAGGLMRTAFEAKHGKPPKDGIVQGLQQEMSDALLTQKRNLLVTRIMLMLVSLDNKRVDYKAKQIVDIIFAEMF